MQTSSYTNLVLLVLHLKFNKLNVSHALAWSYVQTVTGPFLTVLFLASLNVYRVLSLLLLYYLFLKTD